MENILEDEYRETLQDRDQFLGLVETAIEYVNEEEEPCDSMECTPSAPCGPISLIA
jgi:hypothetical protein